MWGKNMCLFCFVDKNEGGKGGEKEGERGRQEGRKETEKRFEGVLFQFMNGSLHLRED